MSLNKPVKSWALYDFANSSYVLVFQSFLLPIFFSKQLSTNGLSLGEWGLVNGISTVFGVCFAIIVGGYADKNIRLRVLKTFVLASFIGMVCLSGAVTGQPELIPYIYILTNAFFITTISLSDSILPFLSQDKNDTFENSGFAWGFGYLGGIVSLIIVILLQKIYGEYSGYVFLSVALFYIGFSYLAIKGLKDVNLNITDTTGNITSNAILNLDKKERLLLLVGFWLVSECITVIILFYSIYASTEIALTSFQIGLTLLVVQLIGFPATFYGGKFTAKYNYLRMFGLTIFVWLIVIFLLVTNTTTLGITLIVLLTGLVIGNSQSYLRSIYSLITSKLTSGKQFGIFALVSQAAIIFGPIIFGYTSDYLGSQRIPLIVIGMLMVVGFFVIKGVMLGIFRKKI